MKVNLHGAATNAYLGVKEIVDFIEDEQGTDYADQALSELQELIVKHQPLLACYCLYENFNGNSVAKQDEPTIEIARLKAKIDELNKIAEEHLHLVILCSGVCSGTNSLENLKSYVLKKLRLDSPNSTPNNQNGEKNEI